MEVGRLLDWLRGTRGFMQPWGIHPHNASQFSDDVLDELRMLSEHAKVVAVGEIGLDYYRNLSPRGAQKRAFEAQLLLGEELELPVVVHDREAHRDVLGILSRFEGRIEGVMHCFCELAYRFCTLHVKV